MVAREYGHRGFSAVESHKAQKAVENIKLCFEQYGIDPQAALFALNNLPPQIYMQHCITIADLKQAPYNATGCRVIKYCCSIMGEDGQRVLAEHDEAVRRWLDGTRKIKEARRKTDETIGRFIVGTAGLAIGLVLLSFAIDSVSSLGRRR